MKRMVLLLCLVTMCLGVGCTAIPQNGDAKRPQTTCRCEVTLDAAADVVRGTQHIDYTLPDDLDEICVWLGTGEIEGVTVDGTEVTYKQEGVYCTVQLGKVGAKGTPVSIDVAFGVACNSKNIQVADYIPLVCAYKEGYVCPQSITYAPYAQVDDYAGTLRCSLPITLAATHSGKRTGIEWGQGQIQTYTIGKGRNILVASPAYVTGCREVDDTSIYTYCYTTQSRYPDKVTRLVQKAQSFLGACPCQITVAEGNEPAVGVGLIVAIGDDTILADQVMLQWILPYCDSPNWIAPGLARFWRWYGYHKSEPDAALRLYQQASQNCRDYAILHPEVPKSMRVLPTSEMGYQMMADRGMLMWYNLYQMVGDQLIAATRYALAKGEDEEAFVTALCHKIGDYRGFLQAWIEGEVWVV